MTEHSVEIKHVEEVVIRFAGDSGDGMQLTGSRFTANTAIVGNDLSTLPDYPAEIRAPAGSLAGVSAFQIRFSSRDIHTPGDQPDVLVAMNPAALKAHLPEVIPGGIIIVNANAFVPKNLALAGYDTNPLEDPSLNQNYTLYSIEMSKLVRLACEDIDLNAKDVERTKNMLALGFLLWMYNRPLENTKTWLKKKFAKKPLIAEANIRALETGRNYGSTTEVFTTRYQVAKASLPPGTYRNMNGNYATALGLAAAAERAGRPLFYGGYPITPASDVLHTLAAWKHLNIRTFQAEDEIAGVAAAIGASFAGNLACTATSGPGVALKTEALGLAVMAELPIVIVNVQRGGPSTGLPTKTEQADLFQAVYGRNGEAPIPVIAASTPGDCFYAAYEAARIAVKYMTPVILLTDGYLGNGSEPWAIPTLKDLPDIPLQFETEKQEGDSKFMPYRRDPVTLARNWAIPGTPGLEHRIGGLEKSDPTGDVNYEPDNHHEMVTKRAQKVAGITREFDPTPIYGPDKGKLLIVTWGSTYGSARSATERLKREGMVVSHVHLRWVNPLPADLGDILSRFETILIPEINTGQLRTIIRAEYLVDAIGLNIVRGRPIRASDIMAKINALLGN